MAVPGGPEVTFRVVPEMEPVEIPVNVETELPQIVDMRHVLCRAIGPEPDHRRVSATRPSPMHGELAERLGRRIEYRSERHAASY